MGHHDYVLARLDELERVGVVTDYYVGGDIGHGRRYVIGRAGIGPASYTLLEADAFTAGAMAALHVAREVAL